MFVETKDTLFDDLNDMINIMNKEKFFMNARGAALRGGDTDRSKIQNRAGSKQVREILIRNGVTTLYELTKKQLKDEIIRIHRSVVTSNLKEPISWRTTRRHRSRSQK